MRAKSLHSCLSLCDAMDCSLPGSSVRGILQARILEGVAISYSRGSSQPKNRTHVSYIYLHWQAGSLSRVPPGKPLISNICTCIDSCLSLVAQMVKHLPSMWETQVPSLGWEDPLEKETATPSSILAWRIPRTEEPGRLQSMESQRVGHDWATSLSFHSYPTEVTNQ